MLQGGKNVKYGTYNCYMQPSAVSHFPHLLSNHKLFVMLHNHFHIPLGILQSIHQGTTKPQDFLNPPADEANGAESNRKSGAPAPAYICSDRHGAEAGACRCSNLELSIIFSKDNPLHPLMPRSGPLGESPVSAEPPPTPSLTHPTNRPASVRQSGQV